MGKRSKQTNNQTIDDLLKNVNKKVEKISGKPFKSMFKINTVKDVIIHPKTNKPAYIFLEDDSYVETYLCKTTIIQ